MTMSMPWYNHSNKMKLCANVFNDDKSYCKSVILLNKILQETRIFPAKTYLPRKHSTLLKAH